MYYLSLIPTFSTKDQVHKFQRKQFQNTEDTIDQACYYSITSTRKTLLTLKPQELKEVDFNSKNLKRTELFYLIQEKDLNQWGSDNSLKAITKYGNHTIFSITVKS
jgi:hypothetical protein